MSLLGIQVHTPTLRIDFFFFYMTNLDVFFLPVQNRSLIVTKPTLHPLAKVWSFAV